MDLAEKVAVAIMALLLAGAVWGTVFPSHDPDPYVPEYEIEEVYRLKKIAP